jgi:fibronectin-binding autotransporter adhesin
MKPGFAYRIVFIAVLLALFFSLVMPGPARAAGAKTHTVFAEQAIERLNDYGGYQELVDILNLYPDIVNFGAIFPDVTFGNVDNDWANFVHDDDVGYENYARYLQYLAENEIDKSNTNLTAGSYKAFLEDPGSTYLMPKFRFALMDQLMNRLTHTPRSADDNMAIAFLFGFIAHQEADWPWHWNPDPATPGWLGVEQTAINNGWTDCGYGWPFTGLNNAESCLDLVIFNSAGGRPGIDNGFINTIKSDLTAAAGVLGMRGPQCLGRIIPWACTSWGSMDPFESGLTQISNLFDMEESNNYYNAERNDFTWQHVPGGIDYGSAYIAGAWMYTWDRLNSHAVYHVKPAVSGEGNCLTWADACTLPLGISKALNAEVWVAAGTYKPTALAGSTPTDSERQVSIQLWPNVAVFGGFPATGDPVFADRDPSGYPTILSGDIDNNDAHHNDTNIDDTTADIAGLNSYHVVTGANNATLDGFTITGGYANNSTANCDSNQGGCGGGMLNNGVNVSVSNVIFSGNYAGVGGGGVYNQNSTSSFANMTFQHNWSTYGGALRNIGGGSTFTDVTFTENSASQNGGAVDSTDSSGAFINALFDGNQAGEDGGAIMVYAVSSPTFTNVTFSNNTAKNGGAVCNLNNHNSGGSYRNVTFFNNTASHEGGGMNNLNGGSPSLTNVTFYQNHAAYSGGAMANITYSNPILKNVTIVDNDITSDANGGGGIYMFDSYNNEVRLYNTILWNNTSSGGTPSQIGYRGTNYQTHIDDSVVQGGGCPANYCAHIYSADPLLGPLQDNGGFTHTMALLPGSPAIDAGNDTTCAVTDQRGVTRPQGSSCDIGAYEFTYCTVTSAADGGPGSLRTLLGDSSCNGIVFAGDTTIHVTNPLMILRNVAIDGGNHQVVISGDTNDDGTPDAQVISVGAGVTAVLSRLTVTKGTNGITNGGTLTVANSTFSGNSATLGGGILNSGTLTVVNSTFSSNSAADSGGGIANAGTLTVANSTFSTNSADNGGGIANYGTLTMANSTFSGNSAASGGAIYLNSASNHFTNVTFVGNSASGNGAAFYNDGGSLEMHNTLISKGAGSANSCYGAPSSYGSNLTDDASCTTGFTQVTDLKLGPLGDNGGPTQTFALLPGSPAIDGGNDAICAAAVGAPSYGAGGLDQRGLSRPQGAHCDIGAFERATCTVTTNADRGAGTLREKIIASECSTINFNGNTTITLASTLPDLGRTLTISGLGHTVTLDGGGKVRIFFIPSSGDVTLENLTLQKGHVDNGGGIFNLGTLMLSDSTFSTNSATDGGGGIYNDGGTLTVTDSTFSTNSADNGGGIANYGTLTVANSTFSTNSATSGGAIYLNSAASNHFKNVTFVGNSASGNGGAFYNDGGSLEMHNTLISKGAGSANSCYGSPGSYGSNLTDDTSCMPGFTQVTDLKLGPLGDNGGPTQTVALLPGSPAIDGGDDAICAAAVGAPSYGAGGLDQRGLFRPQGAHCDIGAFERSTCIVTTDADSGPGSLRERIGLSECSTITFNGDYTITLASDLPDLVRTLTISGAGQHVILDGGKSRGRFGRIFTVQSTGNVTLQALTIRGGSQVDGGGLYNAGTLAVVDSTISGNSAGQFGGGIRNDGTLAVTNSTFSGNSARSGGAVYTYRTGQFTNVTFVGNTASVSGAAYYKLSGSLVMNNTLIAKGSAANSCWGSLSSGDHNLTDDTSCTTGFTQSSTLLLGSLGDHGGPTQTVPLLPGSPAIDAGNDTICAAAEGDPSYGAGSLDQRGVARPQGAACDIGAYESRGFSLAISGGDNQTASYGATFASPLEVAISAVEMEPVDGGLVTFTAPASGASALLTGSPATITGGKASLTAISAGGLGSYSVTASTTFANNVNFSLTNTCSGAMIVANGTDSGNGSLRETIALTCSGGMITFNGDTTIHLASPLTLAQNVTIDGGTHQVVLSGDTNNDGSGDVQVLRVNSGISAELDHLTVTKGYKSTSSVAGSGGGIYNRGTLTIKYSSFTGNSCVPDAFDMCDGGAITNYGGTLTVTNSTFSGNLASYGAGITNYSGTLTASGSLFFGNSASQAGAGIYSANGQTRTFTISNSTLLNNITTNSLSIGAGLFVNGNAQIANLTFVGNNAPYHGEGEAYYIKSGSVTINNVLVDKGADAHSCYVDSSATVSGLNNLADDSTCTTGFTQSSPLLLGSLGDHGGPTQTIPLLSGSPAIDAGNDGICAASPVNNLDQRGVARPQGSHCDIGAYEAFDPTEVTLTSFTAQVEKQPITASGKSVILNWNTASELDTLGFNLYRATALDGARVKINATLITSRVPPGSLFGASYSYKDTVLLDGTLYYWLESVDIHGGRHLTGPVLVKLVAGKIK